MHKILIVWDIFHFPTISRYEDHRIHSCNIQYGELQGWPHSNIHVGQEDKSTLSHLGPLSAHKSAHPPRCLKILTKLWQSWWILEPGLNFKTHLGLVWSGKYQLPCSKQVNLHVLTTHYLRPMWMGPCATSLEWPAHGSMSKDPREALTNMDYW